MSLAKIYTAVYAGYFPTTQLQYKDNLIHPVDYGLDLVSTMFVLNSIPLNTNGTPLSLQPTLFASIFSITHAHHHLSLQVIPLPLNIHSDV